MSKETTLVCCECGAEQTAPTPSKKWKGWRVWLDDNDRSLLGYVCPDCYKAGKNDKYK